MTTAKTVQIDPEYVHHVAPKYADIAAWVVGVIAGAAVGAAAYWGWPLIGPHLFKPCPMLTPVSAGLLALYVMARVKMWSLDDWAKREAARYAEWLRAKKGRGQ